MNLSLEKDIPLSYSWQIHRRKYPELDNYIQCAWELLYEHARPESIHIRLYDCAFFFTDMSRAVEYRRYPGMGNAQFCKVDIIQEYDSFMGDMQRLERIDEHTEKASEIIETFKHYWAGEFTDDSIPELCFAESIVLMQSKKLADDDNE